MIDALVKFGVKDQNVVLSTMAKINKAKKELVKKTNLSFGGGGGGSFGGIRAEINARKQVTQMEREIAARSGREKLAEMKKEQFENNKLVKSASMAGNALKDVARSAATLDPIAFIQGALSAAGKVAGAAPYFGAVAAGGLDLLGVSVGAAGGAIGSAKQSSAAALEIQKRRTQNNLYGGELSFGKADAAYKEKIEKANAAKFKAAKELDDVRNNSYSAQIRRAAGLDDGTRSDEVGKLRERLTAAARKGDTSDKASGWTPADEAQFIQAVSGQFGKIEKPLANILNKFIADGKNVEQFTQVASGNWSALGTDEGAILQQITNGFAGALPSVKQALQTELVKGFGDRVLEDNAETRTTRATSAAWARQEEGQQLRLASLSASKNIFNNLIALDSKLNDVQANLIRGAGRLAEALNRAVDMMKAP